MIWLMLSHITFTYLLLCKIIHCCCCCCSPILLAVFTPEPQRYVTMLHHGSLPVVVDKIAPIIKHNPSGFFWKKNLVRATPSCSLCHHVTGSPHGVACHPSLRQGATCPSSDGEDYSPLTAVYIFWRILGKNSKKWDTKTYHKCPNNGSLQCTSMSKSCRWNGNIVDPDKIVP